MGARILTRLLNELLEPSPCLSTSLDQSELGGPWLFLCERRVNKVKDGHNASCHFLAPVLPRVPLLGGLKASCFPAVTLFDHGLQMPLGIDF